jgi:hypothetical protein
MHVPAFALLVASSDGEQQPDRLVRLLIQQQKLVSFL